MGALSLPCFQTTAARSCLDMEAPWAISLYLQAHFWVRVTITQESSGVGWRWPQEPILPFLPPFLYTFPTSHSWVEPGAPWHLWAFKPRNHYSKVSTCFYSFPWCSTPTLPKTHIDHAVCLLLGKAHLLHLLTLRLLIMELILWKGLDKICPQHTDRPESSRSAAVHFFACVTQSASW